MTLAVRKPHDAQEPQLLDAGLALQEEGLRLLFAEIRALQALIPVANHALPSEAETEADFDNMPV